jgi:aspartate kinase
VKVVVQKFGGTCIETPESRELTAERIMEAKDRDLHPVVVVSAMGRAGTPYSTVELVNMVRRIDEKINPRDLDMLMSCGEIISTAAMAHLLRTKGYETIALTGGQAGLITDYYYGHARIIRIDADYLLECLQAGHMVFVAGFQGISEQHAITTLGEGGSDYTAVALSVIVEQTPKLPFGDDLELHPPLQIYKEVNGVMTADPKHFEAGSSPRTIPALTYDECVSLAAAKTLPRTEFI